MIMEHGDLRMLHRRNRAWQKGNAALQLEKKTHARHEREMATKINVTAWISV